MKTSIKRVPLETIEQQWVIQWANHQFFNLGQGPELVGAYLFAIPNGGSRHAIEAKNLKAEGVTSGVPDLQLIYPHCPFYGLFIEMKRKEKSKARVSTAQKAWIEKLNAVGYRAVVCYGADEAIREIKNYLEIR